MQTREYFLSCPSKKNSDNHKQITKCKYSPTAFGDVSPSKICFESSSSGPTCAVAGCPSLKISTLRLSSATVSCRAANESGSYVNENMRPWLRVYSSHFCRYGCTSKLDMSSIPSIWVNTDVASAKVRFSQMLVFLAGGEVGEEREEREDIERRESKLARRQQTPNEF